MSPTTLKAAAVTKRTLVTCVSSEVGPGCGKRFLETSSPVNGEQDDFMSAGLPPPVRGVWRVDT